MASYIDKVKVMWRGAPPGWWFGRAFGGGWQVAYGGVPQALYAITRRPMSPDTKQWDEMLPSYGALYGGPYATESASRDACKTFSAGSTIMDMASRIGWMSEGGLV